MLLQGYKIEGADRRECHRPAGSSRSGHLLVRCYPAGVRRFRPQGRRIYCASMWVRLANDHDLEVIAGVDAVAGVDPDRIRTLVSQSIADSGCWIAGYGDLPEGYLVLLRRHFFGRDFVSLVAVKSSARRRGLASILFQAAESSATTRQLFTSTNQSNRPMQALLEARGYQKAGVIDHLDCPSSGNLRQKAA